MSHERQYKLAAELIYQADALIIGAGAGMGVDSGLPDFRGDDGFWKAYPAFAISRIGFSSVATPRMFEREPTLAWGFYGHRLELYRRTVPHEGFNILRKWAKAVSFGSWVFTSNVDGQFQRADFSENQIHECHGSIHYLQCMTDCSSGIWSANEFTPSVDMENCRLLTPLPLCPVCGGLARPNIVMFGDNRWRGERRKEQIARQEVWLEKVSRRQGRVVIIELGSGTAVQSVRNFSQKISREYNARIIRINPREWLTSSPKDIGIPCGSLEALTGIDLVLRQRTERH